MFSIFQMNIKYKMIVSITVIALKNTIPYSIIEFASVKKYPTVATQSWTRQKRKIQFFELMELWSSLDCGGEIPMIRNVFLIKVNNLIELPPAMLIANNELTNQPTEQVKIYKCWSQFNTHYIAYWICYSNCNEHYIMCAPARMLRAHGVEN